jgi:SAM-dependent methyltransferase
MAGPSGGTPTPSEGIAGTVLCVDMLEHCERPWLAVEQMRRLLAPGGALLMTSVFAFPIHNHPSDYWRFTPEAVRSLLRPFDAVIVAAWGGDDPALAPRTVAGAGFKAPVDPAAVERLRLAMEAWSRSTPKAAFSWKRWLKRWVLPPGWIEAGRGLRGRPAWSREAVDEVATER